jgi:hypothetical protein
MGLRILMPYWDADVLEMLYRVPPHLLNKGDAARVSSAVTDSQISSTGFRATKKVTFADFFNSMMLQEEKGLASYGWYTSLSELGIVDRERLASAIEEYWQAMSFARRTGFGMS